MAMKLYMFQVAPNPTKVRLYIAEKQARGVRLPIEQIAVDIPAGVPDLAGSEYADDGVLIDDEDDSLLASNSALFETDEVDLTDYGDSD